MMVRQPPDPRFDRRWLAALLLLWAVFCVLSVQACGYGFLRPEAFTLLPHFLQHRPWYEIIFDARGTDASTFQARELGHLLAYLDAHFIRACVLAGSPHFFSLSHYVLMLGCGLLIWQIGIRSLQLSPGVTLGLVALLWTSPSAFLFTSYYRPGKVGLCFGTLFLAMLWLSYQRQPEAARTRQLQILGWLGIAALTLPMYDRQGAAFLFVALGFFLQRALVTQGGRDRRVLLVGAAAFVLALIYNRGISPVLNARLGHLAPNTDYQSLPLLAMFENPRHLAIVAFGAPLMGISSLQFVAGNLSMGALLGGLVGVFYLLRQVKPAGFEPWRTLFRPTHLYLALLLLVIALFALLLVRNPYMFTNEHRRFFYGAPLAAVWIISLALLAAAAQQLWPERRHFIGPAVALLVIGNIFAIPDHRFVLRQGEYAVYRQNARRLAIVLQPDRIFRSDVDPARVDALLAAAPRELENGAPPTSFARNSIYLALLVDYLDAHGAPAPK